MDSKELKVFLAVAESGSLRDAAQRCHLSPSGLSRIIAKLEDEVGIPLFSRSGYALRLSTEGRAFQKHARRAVAVLEDVENFGQSWTLRRKTLLRVAAFSRYVDALAVPALQTLVTAMPQYRFQLDVHVQRDFEWSSRSHLFSLGVGCLPYPPPENLLITEIGRSELVVCLPEGHPLAQKGIIGTDELKAEKMIVLGNETLIGQMSRSMMPFLTSDQIVMQTTNTQAAMQFVCRGTGIHITDVLSAVPYLGRGCKMVRYEIRKPVVVSAFWFNSTDASAAVRDAWCDALKSQLSECMRLAGSALSGGV